MLRFFSCLIFAKLGQPFTEIFPLLQEEEKFRFGTLFHCDINLVAIMAAHYLLKQPKSAGWVGPDYPFKQMQQVQARGTKRSH